MISVYPSSERDFADNGLKILKPLKAVVTKEDNGDYYLDLKDKTDFIDYYQSGMIIRVNTRWGYQGFRITNTEIERDIITVKAKHLYFDSANYIIKDSYVVDKNCNDALDHLNSSCDIHTPFTTISDIDKTSSIRCVRKSLEEAIVTVIDRWGGHLDRDNYNIGIRTKIGQDRGVTISANKNLKSFSKKENWDNVITKILPVGKDGITLPEIYVELPEELYEIPYTKVISFEQYDISEEDYTNDDGVLDEKAYKDALINNLRNQATNYLENNKFPKVNYVVESSIKDVSDIGDTIYIRHPKCKVDLVTNVISIEYDCIQDKYLSIEFGNFRNKLKNLIDNITSTIEDKTNKSIKENTSILEKELKEATNSIKSAMSNSYVIYNGDKILIVDKLPAEEAKNCILINNGGIGFSKDGINGIFNSAWEIDGTLNMQHINVINLVADMIKGGTLKIGGNNNANGVVEIYDNNGKLITKIDNNGLNFNISEIINLTRESSNDGNYLILDKTPTSIGAINKLIISNFNKQLLYPNMTRPFKSLNTKYLNFYTLIFSNEEVIYSKVLPQASAVLENKVYNIAGINGKYYRCLKNNNIYEWVEANNLTYQEIYIPSPIPLQKVEIDGKIYSDEIYIENNNVKIIQNISKSGTLLSKPIIHDIGAYTIPTFSPNTYLTLKYFNNLHFESKYMVENDFTNIFTTQAEQTAEMQIIANQIASKVSQKDMESAIIQMADEINIEVKKKVNNDEIISAINLSSEEAKILAKKIILEGLVTANEYFKVLLDGSIEAKNGSFAGNIYLGDGGLVVGGTGILNTMVIPGVINSPGFLLSGDFCPMGDYWDGSNIHTKEHISFSFYIPEKFTIISAYIYLQHEPCETDYWEYGTSATTQSKRTGYCRNLALYKGTMGSYSKKYISELAANFVGNANVNYSQVTSAWQNSGTLFNGSNNSINSDVSINLKSQNLISSGLNHLAIMSTGGTTGDLTGAYYEKRGAVLATLYIQGYLKN